MSEEIAERLVEHLVAHTDWLGSGKGDAAWLILGDGRTALGRYRCWPSSERWRAGGRRSCRRELAPRPGAVRRPRVLPTPGPAPHDRRVNSRGVVGPQWRSGDLLG